MVSDIWSRTTQREEARCHHFVGYSLRLIERDLLYAPSYRYDSTYHGLWFISRAALVGTRNSQWINHDGSIRRPIAP